MKKTLAVFLFFIFLLVLAPVFQRVIAKADSRIIRVPYDYSTIQLAIDTATLGDSILVSSGIYHENLVVNKSLTLIGENRQNTIIDGGMNDCAINVISGRVTIDGFTVNNSTIGIQLTSSLLSVISGNIITESGEHGIYLSGSHNNTIVNNLIINITHHFYDLIWGNGIVLMNSNNNIVEGNVIEDCVDNVIISKSNGTIISWNSLNALDLMLVLESSKSNIIHHNQFAKISIYQEQTFNNSWDDGSAGNYWDSYTGLDDGSNGRVAGDGIGDTDLPYRGVDNYPLVQPPQPIPVVINNTIYPVLIHSNSTVYGFGFAEAGKTIYFYTIGPYNTTGFWNVTVPKSFMTGNPWQISLNGHYITSNTSIAENNTHTSMYFAYEHGNNTSNCINVKGTQILPEYSATSLIALVLVATPATIILSKHFKSRRKHKPTC